MYGSYELAPIWNREAALDAHCTTISQKFCTTHLPNHQWWYATWKLSWNTHTLHARFCTFGADLYAQSVLINEISASKLSRKSIKSALLVGYVPPLPFVGKYWIMGGGGEGGGCFFIHYYVERQFPHCLCNVTFYLAKP